LLIPFDCCYLFAQGVNHWVNLASSSTFKQHVLSRPAPQALDNQRPLSQGLPISDVRFIAVSCLWQPAVLSSYVAVAMLYFSSKLLHCLILQEAPCGWPLLDKAPFCPSYLALKLLCLLCSVRSFPVPTQPGPILAQLLGTLAGVRRRTRGVSREGSRCVVCVGQMSPSKVFLGVL
jgi:hypothetical protein